MNRQRRHNDPAQYARRALVTAGQFALIGIVLWAAFGFPIPC